MANRRRRWAAVVRPHAIRAVVFDLGGTLEEIHYDERSRQEAARGLQALLSRHGLNPGLALPDLQAAVEMGFAGYQRWREQTMIELPPERVWIEYVFRHQDLMPDRLAAAAEDLTFYYENHFYTRTLRSEASAVLAELRGRGFHLAIISNIISRTLVPHNLALYGVDHFFNPIVTSAGLGLRKPDPRIFLETARLLGLRPAACAYVGDTVSRDVTGARGAGYGMAIQIRSFLTDKSDRETETEVPDAVVCDLAEVIPLVAGGRGGPGAGLGGVV